MNHLLSHHSDKIDADEVVLCEIISLLKSMFLSHVAVCMSLLGVLALHLSVFVSSTVSVFASVSFTLCVFYIIYVLVLFWSSS